MIEPATILDRLVAKTGQLYTLPAVAMQVLELTGDLGVDAHELKKCIENDPALATKILRVVNSSLFGLSRQVSDLSQALALLGVKPLKLLVLGFSLPTRLLQDVAGDVLAQFWRHTLTRAVAAREIAETLWHQPGDEAFIAGLLQDLGQLLLIQELGEPYVEFLRKIHAERADLFAWEMRSLGFDHTQLTAAILQQWQLPRVLVQAVQVGGDSREKASVETPTSALESRPTLRHVLHLAELLSRLLADGNTCMLDEVLAAGNRYGSLTAARLEGLVGSLEEKVRQLADILSLDLLGGADYADVLARAHRRLAEVASEAAVDMMLTGRSPHVASPGEAGDSLLQQVHSLCANLAVARHQDPAALNTRGRRLVTSPAAAVRAEAPAARETTGATVFDPGLIGHLAAAVAACRQSRSALSLLLVDPIDVQDLLLRFASEGYAAFRRLLEATCRSLGDDAATCLPHGEAGFALVLPDCERQAAVRLGNQVIDRLRLPMATGNRRGIALAVGAATVSLPPKNFPAEDLLTAADRCLYGSRLSGGGVVKSIEIY